MVKMEEPVMNEIQNHAKQFVYVGCRTTEERNARGKGIKVFEIQPDGEWKLIQTVKNLVNPSYLCKDITGKYLYTIHGDFSEISAFSVDEKTGMLTYIYRWKKSGSSFCR